MSSIFKLLTMPDLMHYLIPMLEYRDVVALIQTSMRAFTTVSPFILFLKYGAYNKLVFRDKALVLEPVGNVLPVNVRVVAWIGSDEEMSTLKLKQYCRMLLLLSHSMVTLCLLRVRGLSLNFIRVTRLQDFRYLRRITLHDCYPWICEDFFTIPSHNFLLGLNQINDVHFAIDVYPYFGQTLHSKAFRETGQSTGFGYAVKAIFSVTATCPDMLKHNTSMQRWILYMLTIDMPGDPSIEKGMKLILVRMGCAGDCTLADLLDLVRLHVLLSGNNFDPKANYARLFDCNSCERTIPGRCFAKAQWKSDYPVCSGCTVADNLRAGIDYDMGRNDTRQFIALQDDNYFEAMKLFFVDDLSKEVKTVTADGIGIRTLTYNQVPSLRFVFRTWFGWDPLAESETTMNRVYRLAKQPPYDTESNDLMRVQAKSDDDKLFSDRYHFARVIILDPPVEDVPATLLVAAPVVDDDMPLNNPFETTVPEENVDEVPMVPDTASGTVAFGQERLSGFHVMDFYNSDTEDPTEGVEIIIEEPGVTGSNNIENEIRAMFAALGN